MTPYQGLIEDALKTRREFSLALRSGCGWDITSRPSIWIADTGATDHTTFSQDGMINLHKSEAGMVASNGQRIEQTACGDIPCLYINNKDNNNNMRITISQAQVSPANKFNLFSMNKAMKSGWNLTGDNDAGLTLHKGKE